jgi:hypothetical protein
MSLSLISFFFFSSYFNLFREKCVCVVKRGCPEGRQLFSTDEHIIALEVMTADHSVLVICCDNTLACYSRKVLFITLDETFLLKPEFQLIKTTDPSGFARVQ